MGACTLSSQHLTLVLSAQAGIQQFQALLYLRRRGDDLLIIPQCSPIRTAMGERGTSPHLAGVKGPRPGEPLSLIEINAAHASGQTLLDFQSRSTVTSQIACSYVSLCHIISKYFWPRSPIPCYGDDMIVIVGGGVVGMHIAIALAARPNHPDIMVLEREQFLGDHSTGRNSQVIHAGFAYPQGSLKARLCVEGNRLSYKWLEKLGVTHSRNGKWIVAFTADELPALDMVLKMGSACDVPGMREASSAEIKRSEPDCLDFAGVVYSETSGMMDAAEYIRALERYFIAQPDCYLVYPCGVTGIDPDARSISTTRGDMEYSMLINAAGLWADEVYHWCGGTRDLRIKPFKGEYYVWKGGTVQSILYPVPRRYLPGAEHDQRLVSSMGIHLHRDTGGQLFVGPTQVEQDWDQKSNYDIITPRAEFVRQAERFAPVADPESFEPAYAGNRPKVFEDGNALGDYLIFREGEHHLHLLGIESPGLTASPAIGRYVADMLDDE